jgi:prepilin signal peptidase PulO-like enzyme (type II secretory pathway)
MNLTTAIRTTRDDELGFGWSAALALLLPCLLFAAIAPFSVELAIVATIGLVLGHTTDLLFDRLYTGAPIDGPIVRCQACRSSLHPAYLVPLAGAVGGRGKCVDCGTSLPLRAFFLAVGAEALFVGAYFALGGSLIGGLLGGFFATVFLSLTFTDLETRLLPNRVVYPATLLAIGLSWAWPETTMLAIVAGGVVAVAVAAILLLLSLPFGSGSFGMGDVKTIVLMGFVLGVPSVFIGIFVGTVAGGIIAALLLVMRLRSRKDHMPHGPFLAFGAIVGLFFGPDLWDWYLAGR